MKSDTCPRTFIKMVETGLFRCILPLCSRFEQRWIFSKVGAYRSVLTQSSVRAVNTPAEALKTSNSRLSGMYRVTASARGLFSPGRNETGGMGESEVVWPCVIAISRAFHFGAVPSLPIMRARVHCTIKGQHVIFMNLAVENYEKNRDHLSHQQVGIAS